MKFKVGDSVKISPRAYSYGAGNTGNLSSFDGKHWWIDAKYCCGQEYMEAVMRTINDLREGDRLVCGGSKCTVEAIHGKCISLVSEDEMFVWHTTITYLKQYNYEIVQPKPATVTITVDGKETVISRESAESLNLI